MTPEDIAILSSVFVITGVGMIAAGFAWLCGYERGELSKALELRAKVSDECGKEAAQRVFGEEKS